MNISLKHRSASAQLDGASWEFTPLKGTKDLTSPVDGWAEGPTVYLRLRLGSKIHELDVPVCGERRLVPLRWVLAPLRGSREAWLLSGRVPEPPNEMPVPYRFRDDLPALHVELLCCPPDIADEIARL